MATRPRDVSTLPKWAQNLIEWKDRHITALRAENKRLQDQAAAGVDEAAQVWQFSLSDERIVTLPYADSSVSFGRRGPLTSTGWFEVVYDQPSGALTVSCAESALAIIPGPGSNTARLYLADHYRGRRA